MTSVDTLPLPDGGGVDPAAVPFDAAIVAVITTALTYAVRRYLIKDDIRWLDNKPQVLFWVSAGAAVIGGGINALVQGQGLKQGLLAALTGWLAAQGLRRAKKGVGVS